MSKYVRRSIMFKERISSRKRICFRQFVKTTKTLSS